LSLFLFVLFACPRLIFGLSFALFYPRPLIVKEKKKKGLYFYDAACRVVHFSIHLSDRLNLNLTFFTLFDLEASQSLGWGIGLSPFLSVPLFV